MTLVNDSEKNVSNQIELRKMAEEFVEVNETAMSKCLKPLISENVASLVHELRVHKTELEMQNEELTRAQIEILALQERYFNLYEYAPVGYMTLSRKGIILECNLAAISMIGFNRRKLLGSPISRLILKEDQPIYYAKLKLLQLSDEQQNIELRMVKQDGTEFWANLTIVGAISDHTDVASRIIMNDISDRKAIESALVVSEKRYKSLFNYAGVAIAYYQIDGTVISFNHVAAGNLGGTFEDFSGRSVYDIFSQVEAELYMRRIREAALSDIPQEYEDCSKLNTNETWYLNTYSKVIDEKGSISGIQIISKNITDLKNREREFKVAKELAESANTAKSQFLANMSHEIRTPMNGIYGALQLLEMTNLNEEQIELVNIVHFSTEGLLELVNDIFDFTKIEAGDLKIEYLPFKLDALIHETIDLFRMASEKKGITIKTSFDEQVPNELMGDPLLLRKILSNLIDNGIKFTISGQIEVAITPYSVQKSEGTTLQFSVKDTGIGIASDVVGRVFDRFNQVDNSNTRDYGGAGLGLAICKGLVEKMGGEIWVVSTYGEGSTFNFTCHYGIQDLD